MTRDDISMLWHHGEFSLRAALAFGMLTFAAGTLVGALLAFRF